MVFPLAYDRSLNPALSISPNYRRVRNRATYFAVFRHWDQLKRAPFDMSGILELLKVMINLSDRPTIGLTGFFLTWFTRLIESNIARMKHTNRTS